MNTKIKVPYFTSRELAFISTMVAFDIGSGMFLKPLLGLSGITAFLRLDMILPLTIMFFTAKWTKKTGTILLYEFLWAILASFVMPFSFNAPGIIKLLPALIFASVFEFLYYILPSRNNIKLLGAAVVGSVVNQFALMGVKILLGYPFLNIIKISFIIQTVTLIPIAMFSVVLTEKLYLKFNKGKFSLMFREMNIASDDRIN